MSSFGPNMTAAQGALWKLRPGYYLSRQCDRSCEPFGRSGLLAFANRADSGGRLAIVAEIEDSSVICLHYAELKSAVCDRTSRLWH